MKILCVIDSLCPGGAQRQIVELALGFREKGNEVSFLTYHDVPFFHPVLEKARILVNRIEEPNYLLRLLKMRKYIRLGKFDSVLSFLEAPNFICEIAGLPYRKWKLVVGERSANPEITKSFKLKIYRWFHFFADYIVANSHANLKLVYSACPLLPGSKGIVIYNSVDFNLMKPAVKYTPRLDSKFKLIVAARQTYEKNLNGLIDAISLLKDKDRNKLIIEWYGDKMTEPYMDNSFIEALKKIEIYGLDDIFTFSPATPDIARFIQDADAVGIFSFYEGFPNSACEGMACAKPIICSEISDLPELLSYDKRLLFDPTDPQSIRNALSYLIRLSSEQLELIGAENLKICHKSFDKERILNEYLTLLRE
jgi:glycosyltransferase involved in cell wall biosynthesis